MGIKKGVAIAALSVLLVSTAGAQAEAIINGLATNVADFLEIGGSFALITGIVQILWTIITGGGDGAAGGLNLGGLNFGGSTTKTPADKIAETERKKREKAATDKGIAQTEKGEGGTLVFVVNDAVSGERVADADVKVDGFKESAVSKGTGIYQYSGVVPFDENLTISVSKNGYFESSNQDISNGSDVIVLSKANPSKELHIDLVPKKGTVGVIVQEKTSQIDPMSGRPMMNPLSGVTVKVEGHNLSKTTEAPIKHKVFIPPNKLGEMEFGVIFEDITIMESPLVFYAEHNGQTKKHTDISNNTQPIIFKKETIKSFGSLKQDIIKQGGPADIFTWPVANLEFDEKAEDKKDVKIKATVKHEDSTPGKGAIVSVQEHSGEIHGATNDEGIAELEGEIPESLNEFHVVAAIPPENGVRYQSDPKVVNYREDLIEVELTLKKISSGDTPDDSAGDVDEIEHYVNSVARILHKIRDEVLAEKKLEEAVQKAITDNQELAKKHKDFVTVLQDGIKQIKFIESLRKQIRWNEKNLKNIIKHCQQFRENENYKPKSTKMLQKDLNSLHDALHKLNMLLDQLERLEKTETLNVQKLYSKIKAINSNNKLNREDNLIRSHAEIFEQLLHLNQYQINEIEKEKGLLHRAEISLKGFVDKLNAIVPKESK